MADPFVAEVRIFPFNFAPKGWAWCDGQLLPISQNTALFSLLGTTYGGNGKSNFALPDLKGRAPMFWGQGPGLSLYDIGEAGGSETVALLESEMPSHNHGTAPKLGAVADLSASRNPSNSNIAISAGFAAYSNATLNTQLGSGTISQTGSNLPHNNMQPYLTFYFCIALQGVFPPRG
jgi:microcystin-dependent protein